MGVMVGILLAFYYNVVVSWSLKYLATALSALIIDYGKLEWCNPKNTSETCSQTNGSNFTTDVSCTTSSVEDFWNVNVLGIVGHDWNHFGIPRMQNVIALGSAWLLVACCLMKGVKTSGRVSYLTSILPYIILIILAFRSFSLPGALDGLKAFTTPKWENLLTLDIWKDAAKQIIFSLGPACGCVITLSSYNEFNRDCHRDAVTIAVANGLTSIFSGSVVFSILGYMANQSGKPVLDVVKSDIGLAFIAYPEIVCKLPYSALLATLFFAMLILLALGSIFGAFETVITALCDQWPSLREFKTHLVVLTAFSMTMLGLPFTCPAGIHMFSLFNQAAPSWNLILFALLEVIIVAWIYGVDSFIEHISEMKGGMCYAMKVIIFPPFRLDYRLGVSILSLIWKRTLII